MTLSAVITEIYERERDTEDVNLIINHSPSTVNNKYRVFFSNGIAIEFSATVNTAKKRFFCGWNTSQTVLTIIRLLANVEERSLILNRKYLREAIHTFKETVPLRLIAFEGIKTILFQHSLLLIDGILHQQLKSYHMIEFFFVPKI